MVWDPEKEIASWCITRPVKTNTKRKAHRISVSSNGDLCGWYWPHPEFGHRVFWMIAAGDWSSVEMEEE